MSWEPVPGMTSLQVGELLGVAPRYAYQLFRAAGMQRPPGGWNP